MSLLRQKEALNFEVKFRYLKKDSLLPTSRAFEIH